MTSAFETVAPRMRSLQQLGGSLKRLDMMWKVIETTARVVSPADSAGFIAALATTRASFGALAQDMAEQIATTLLANCQRDLASKAQVAIDILVRNLFERTADVGFIATDGPLVDFVQSPASEAATALRARLHEYRQKYTVYADILVLNTQAQALLSLLPRGTAATNAPPWWGQAMAASQYVETYGKSSLYPGTGELLTYAHRIVSAHGVPCGAIVLRFDLASECQSIFASLVGASERVVLLLVDEQERVVASSRPSEFQPRESVALQPARKLGVMSHGRHQYLAQVCSTRGYQGYTGLPWCAVALVRLDQAFAQDKPGTQSGHPDDIHIDADSPPLRTIMAQSQAIEQGLKQVIWNGKLTDASTLEGASIHPVFEEIGRTGRQTVQLFNTSILSLRQLSMTGRRAEMRAHAALAVDIMDRNLYERANDCRWWALSDKFAQILFQLRQGDSAELRAEAAAVLAHLNSLYTVYRRIALFDQQGQVVAVSRDPEGLEPGLRLDADLVRRTLELRGTQAYTVSAMEASPLSDGAAAYVYCAAIRGAGEAKALGGIALAFNCADELRAMLRDSLPAGGQGVGFFVSESGRVLSCSDDSAAPGEVLPFAAELMRGAMPDAALVHWRENEYLAGVALSSGYREFKKTDGYVEPVYSVLLGPVQRQNLNTQGDRLPATQSAGHAPRYGVVVCGKLLFGLRQDQVLRACDVGPIVASSAAGGSGALIGLMEHQAHGRTVMVRTFDFCQLSGQAPLADPMQALAVLVLIEGETVALLVDRLIDVIECTELHPPPEATRVGSPWISGMVSDQGGSELIVYTVDMNNFELG